MSTPGLRIVVDGDSNKIYKKGERVTGKVILVVEEQERIESLNVMFAGSCVTKTSRPFHVNSNSDTGPSRRDFEEKVRLFTQNKEIIARANLAPKKYSWPFDFTFPESTEPRYKKVVHGANYQREPHPIPPSFQLKTSVPGGAAQISYLVQVKLVLGGSKGIKRCKQGLLYHPLSQTQAPWEPKTTSTVLYGQTWKPEKGIEEPRKAVSKVFSRGSTGNGPRIVPCLSHPEQIAPGQHIPLSLTLMNTRGSLNQTQGECVLDSLSVTISTYSATMCGNSIVHPEDVVSKHVTCIARTDINKALPFGQPKALTSNFRLVDDRECVPSFRTYTITRRYTLSISIGIKYNDKHFTIKSTTPLEILPRVTLPILPPPPEDGDDVDPLPLYEPREPSKEFAPDYESIYALSRTTSSENSVTLTGSSRSSLFSGRSMPSSAVSTPANEIDQAVFERSMVQRV